MSQLLGQLSLAKPSSRRLGMVAMLLGVSALAHTGILLGGGSWEGAVSFRKPVTFGVSVGLLLWTCGWIMDRLPDRPRLETALSTVLAVSALVEVALITVQAWRGVPSHFNVFTPGDNAVFSVMGIAIGVFSVGLAAVFLWSLLQRPADRTTRLVVWAGMALVMAGLGLGSWVIQLGMEMVERLGRVPDTVLSGEAGVAKFPHAMALHGIQLFIGVSVLGRALGVGERRRLAATRLVVAGYTALVLWSIVHTNAGRAPADLSGVETSLLAVGSILLIAAGLALVVGRHSLDDPAAPPPSISYRSEMERST